ATSGRPLLLIDRNGMRRVSITLQKRVRLHCGAKDTSGLLTEKNC
ncbi:MAG: hypothetical protein ACI9VI_003303, partial [Candidatus Azotimanducaceae bacterium]